MFLSYHTLLLFLLRTITFSVFLWWFSSSSTEVILGFTKFQFYLILILILLNTWQNGFSGATFLRVFNWGGAFSKGSFNHKMFLSSQLFTILSAEYASTDSHYCTNSILSVFDMVKKIINSWILCYLQQHLFNNKSAKKSFCKLLLYLYLCNKYFSRST